ncbi:hypothetical protein [Streptomyces ureilyticus]|uniref:hypothetical protein n=1 Tax=Streptomyces ureilyticus TaxID=1775131 RepID=UPI0019CFD642|nr:hypothetical protein [Streptomyces ureilyticus]
MRPSESGEPWTGPKSVIAILEGIHGLRVAIGDVEDYSCPVAGVSVFQSTAFVASSPVHCLPVRSFSFDYDDAYAIDRVGLYLSRQGGLITWSVPEFLTALGARVPLPRLRTQLRDHLRQAQRSAPSKKA